MTGLEMLLIDDILLSPLKAIIWLGSKIDEVARRELTDAGRIKEKLMELQLRFELDEISGEEYDRGEKDLLELLDAATNK